MRRSEELQNYIEALKARNREFNSNRTRSQINAQQLHATNADLNQSEN
jgi:hypothetical protein